VLGAESAPELLDGSVADPVGVGFGHQVEAADESVEDMFGADFLEEEEMVQVEAAAECSGAPGLAAEAPIDFADTIAEMHCSQSSRGESDDESMEGVQFLDIGDALGSAAHSADELAQVGVPRVNPGGLVGAAAERTFAQVVVSEPPALQVVNVEFAAAASSGAAAGATEQGASPTCDAPAPRASGGIGRSSPSSALPLDGSSACWGPNLDTPTQAGSWGESYAAGVLGAGRGGSRIGIASGDFASADDVEAAPFDEDDDDDVLMVQPQSLVRQPSSLDGGLGSMATPPPARNMGASNRGLLGAGGGRRGEGSQEPRVAAKAPSASSTEFVGCSPASSSATAPSSGLRAASLAVLGGPSAQPSHDYKAELPSAAASTETTVAAAVAAPIPPAPTQHIQRDQVLRVAAAQGKAELPSAAASAEATVAAAVAAPPPPAPTQHIQRGQAADASGDVWCTTHFQYRWRCREAGVAGACDAASSSGAANEGGSSSSTRGGGGSAGRMGGARSAAGRGRDAEAVLLGDEEMEDLEIQRMQAELEDERRELRGDLRRAKQRSDTVTPEMQAEVEQLLEAFGIPFVHAPAEAEAQCAFLAEARLVDAVASDDSDTLVFGGREVYRRLFSDDHMVECYTMAHLESRLGLAQADLVVLAMLLGCDYTLGVHGVGIVNGLEIVRAFLPGQAGPGRAAAAVNGDQWLESLRKLRAWSSNVAGWDEASAGIDETDPKALASFKRSHRNFRTQWSFPEDFPDPAVHKAFVQPVVDRSLEPFAWSGVDKESVVGLLASAAGLSEDKVLERLDPSLRRYTDALRQPRITDYMVPSEGSGDVAVVRSARLSNALRGLRGLEGDSGDEGGEGGADAGSGGGGEAHARPAKPRQPRPKRPRVAGQRSQPQGAEPPQEASSAGWALQSGGARIELDLESD